MRWGFGMSERVEKYLWDVYEVSRLIIDEATVKSIGTYLDVRQSVIQCCLSDYLDSIQLAGFKLLMEL